MTDTQTAIADFASCQAAHAARADARLQHLKQAVISPLREAGIVTVEVRFDGYGDSGAVEECTCRDAAGHPVPCPEVTIEDLPDAGDAAPVRQVSLQSSLEDLTYLALERHHPGWENNEGAGGTLEIDVTAESFMLDCKLRYIECDDHYTEL
jgi:hypothetical protein